VDIPPQAIGVIAAIAGVAFVALSRRLGGRSQAVLLKVGWVLIGTGAYVAVIAFYSN